MLKVLRNRSYAKLFLAQVLALLGTGLLTVALGLLAYELAGDAAGLVMGTALTCKMVAYVVFAPLIAALVDQLPKKAVLVGADLIRLSIALILPFASETWHIYVLIFLLQTASATFTPAFQALIPAVLPGKNDYTNALALSRMAYDLESLISPIVAAALLVVTSYHNLFLGTAFGFLASAALVLATTLPSISVDANASSFWQRLPIGLRTFQRTPTLRFLMLANVVVAPGTALVLVNSVVYTRTVFGKDETALALTLASYGIGSLVVALLIPKLVSLLGVIATMGVGLGLVSLGLIAAAVLSLQPNAWGWHGLLALWTLLGIGTSLINTPSSRLLADASTPENRNLVYTAQFALSHACFLVAYPIAGWLGAWELTAAAIALAALALLATIGALSYAAQAKLRTASDLPQP